jgi:hypothetical protein
VIEAAHRGSHPLRDSDFPAVHAFSVDPAANSVHGPAMAEKQKRKEKPNVRSHRLVVYITEEDSAELYRVANLLQMSRSSFVTGILERMIIGGFSAVVGAKVGWQIQTRLEELGHSATSLYFGIRPLPALADEELSKRETNQLLSTIKHEITC